MKHFNTRTKGLGDAKQVKNKVKNLVDGYTVMKLTGATGPEIGRILKATEEWILNDKPNATKQEVEQYVMSIK